ncbi:DUF2786 domain-containing protein [Mycobacterium sp. 94-17]|uniref:DUF2786 domain-containing protein n=1 Tax=Mycobacterium sp. 94-17 TaxID=2986147 RepID=UPI002D1ED2A6|nr:DUF2786 domain-containing protein [Mycobacterium sp. 94-17]MEB4210988.1 DUF2786 domain-containing protein [Mycobacterium sp. 94-17]
MTTVVDPAATRNDRRQELLTTLKKLQAKADDAELGDRPAEANAYHEKIAQLMAKYGVSEAMLRSHGGDSKINANAKSVTVHLVGSYLPMQAHLLGQLCHAMQCSSVRWPQRDRKIKMQLYGMEDHLRRIRDMWDLLMPQADRGITNAHPGFGAKPSEVATHRRNWIDGFGDAVYSRIQNAENTAAQTAGAVELYKSDRERAEIAMYAEHPRVKAPKASDRQHDPFGYEQGWSDGQSARLNKEIDCG